MDKHLVRILLGGAIFTIAFFINSEILWLKPAIFLVNYLIVGGDILIRAMRNMVRGQVFDENLLMSIATMGAFLIGEYPEVWP